MGYSKEKARDYAILVGASEAALQYVLGGIGRLGGVTDDILLKKIAAIDKAWARMTLTGAVKIGGEVAEENLQEFIEPAIRSIIFDEKYNAPNMEELIYTTLLAVATTGFMESGDIVRAGAGNISSDSKMQNVPMKALAVGENSATVSGKESGLVYDTYVSQSIDSKTANVIDAVAKALKIKVLFADSVAGGLANAQISNGTVLIEKGNPNPVRFLFGHEITHRMQELAPKEYSRLRDTIAANSESVDADIRKMQDNYAKYGKDINKENAMDEVVADYIGRLLEDKGELERFIAKNRGDRSLMQKLRDFIHEIRLRLMDSEYAARLRQVEQRLSETLNAAVNQTQNIERTQKNAAQESGDNLQYSIHSRFYEQFDKWDKKTTGFSFVVGETSKALQEAGIPLKQIRLDASKVVKLLNKHSGMTTDVIRQIPELLENPVIVIDSKKSSDAKIVMGYLVDSNNRVVTVVLLLTPTSKKGNVLDLIKISSAEGRSHIKSLFTSEDGTAVPIRYIDKKRIQSWLNVNRLQLPLHNLGSDSINSISQKDGTVNGQYSLKTPQEPFSFLYLERLLEHAKRDGNIYTQRLIQREIEKAQRNSRSAGIDASTQMPTIYADRLSQYSELVDFEDKIDSDDLNADFENDANSDTINTDDIVIGKSLGAKAKNYDIELPNGETIHLTEGTKVFDVKIIAGKGRNRQIDEIDFLLERFGGNELEWQKKKGLGYVDYQGESFLARLHWYEEPTAGKHKWKVKPDADGNWFLYED